MDSGRLLANREPGWRTLAVLSWLKQVPAAETTPGEGVGTETMIAVGLDTGGAVGLITGEGARLGSGLGNSEGRGLGEGDGASEGTVTKVGAEVGTGEGSYL